MPLQELVIISGKGGTGKTSIAASFAALAQQAVIADCDVDAADLHLVLSPRIQHRAVFRSGCEARVQPERCNGCGMCARFCRYDAVRRTPDTNGRANYSIDPLACEGCGVCVRFCPRQAITFEERTCGEWFVSTTQYGPMVHAKLGIAAENSGRLVSLVRDQARKLAETCELDLIIIDGSPGIGCPVIASITGAASALVVSEPTVSGLHDLERIAGLTGHFSVPTWVCVNRWDINPAMTERIESIAREQGLHFAGRVRLDPAVTAAQLVAQPVVQHTTTGAGEDIRGLWRVLSAGMSERPGDDRDGLCDESAAQDHLVRPDIMEQERLMKIAVPLDNGHVSMHFGHCAAFALYEVDDTSREVLSQSTLPAPPHEPGVLPGWLHERGANVVITGGMGRRAQDLFAEHGIRVVVGAPSALADDVVASFLNGALQAGANVCDH
jgi:MinD superfamily P-loop ATPase/predicted Fe-Mo cluster-binding NifX family protein